MSHYNGARHHHNPLINAHSLPKRTQKTKIEKNCHTAQSNNEIKISFLHPSIRHLRYGYGFLKLKREKLPGKS